MRYSHIKEAKMSKSKLLSTTPNFPITCGFEVEVAISDRIARENFDFDEHFGNMGESFEMPQDEIDALYDKYSVGEVLDIANYEQQMLSNTPDGYRLATEEERSENLKDVEISQDDYIVIVDEDDSETYSIDITDISDIEEWFPEIYSTILEDYQEEMETIIEDAKQQYKLDKMDEVDTDVIMAEMVMSSMYNVVQHDIVTTTGYHDMEKSGDEYVIEPDSSIIPSGMEIVSPVFGNLDEMFEELENILDEVSTSNFMSTNDSTGLHINIGGFDANSLDYLKLVVFLGESKLGKDFDREYNPMTEQIIPRITRYFAKEGIQPYHLTAPETFNIIIDDTKSFIRNSLLKYYSVNFEKIDNGYLEFRSLGGSGYEDNFDDIRLSVLRMVRALNIALDPTAYRKEYIKKVHSLTFGGLASPKPAGKTTYPEIENAKSFVRNLYRFMPTDFITNHEDFVVAIIKVHDEYNNRNNQMLEMTPNDYSTIRNIYSRLKARNLKSEKFSLEYAKGILKDKEEFMPSKTFTFLSLLIQ